MGPQEIITRGDLPHWYVPGTAHFVTYRLAGTIPATLLREWRERRERMKAVVPPGVSDVEHRLRLHKQFFREYDDYVDTHVERRWLGDERVAAIIRENLWHHNGGKYQLLCYCIMPNHVHVLLQPFELRGATVLTPSIGAAEAGSDEIRDSRSPLTTIMHSLKSYTANRANAVLGRCGQFWEHESYDHWVRDLEDPSELFCTFDPIQ